MATHNDLLQQPLALDARDMLLDAHDTGQDRETLAVAFHQVHRIDGEADGEQELVASTLKYFQLDIACQDAETARTLFHRDGTTLVANAVYEDGTPVTETSATGEPPLLASAGACPPKAVIEGGVAQFKLRLTVLSSLCNKRSFAIHVAAEGAPHLAVTTATVKTITKLKRTPREGSAAAREAARLDKLDNAESRKILSSLLLPPATENKRRLAAALHDGDGCGDGLGASGEGEHGLGAWLANKSKRSSPLLAPLAEGDEAEAALDAEPFSCSLAELSASCVSGLAEDVDGCGARLDTLSAPDALLGHHGLVQLGAGTGGAGAPLKNNAELWEEVSANGAKLLALQEMQKRLFRELRALKEITEVAEQEVAASTATHPAATQAATFEKKQAQQELVLT